MPLARILSFLAEDASPLSQQLERLGFDVEIANPNQEQFAPADLEIEFAICDQQQVLARAAAIAAQLRAEVVVFPGAIPALPAARVAELPGSATAPREIRDQHQEHEPRQGKRELDLLQLPAGGWFPSTREKLLKIGQQAASGYSKLSQGMRRGMQRLRPLTGSWLTKLKTGVFTTGASIRERVRGYQERIKLRAAEIRAARKQPLAELERQLPETLGQESRKAAERAVATHQQLQTAQAEREKRLAEMDRLRAEAREQVAALERARFALEAEQERLQQNSEPPSGRRRRQRLQPSQLRGAFTGAVAASVLFIVGMLVANFHASAPLRALPNSGSVEQQVPFGATTVHGAPGVTVGGARPPKPVRRANTVPRQMAPAQRQPQSSTTSAAPAKPKSQWHRLPRSSRDEGDDVVANEVVVRHYGQPQKAAAKNKQQQAGLKHYSDQ